MAPMKYLKIEKLTLSLALRFLTCFLFGALIPIGLIQHFWPDYLIFFTPFAGLLTLILFFLVLVPEDNPE